MLQCFDGCVKITRMPYHVRISIVNHDHGINTFGDRLRSNPCHFGCRHCWLFVIGGYPWTIDQHAIVTFTGFFHPTVKEVGYMGILFGLG